MQFSQCEIQQLQEVLREEIYQLTQDKSMAVATAKYYSEYKNKERASYSYRSAEIIQQKINKLAELQRKLKRTKWSLIEVDPWFFDEDSDDDMGM